MWRPRSTGCSSRLPERGSRARGRAPDTALARAVRGRPECRDRVDREQRARGLAGSAGASYWADSGFIAAAGIPTVLLGPSGEGAHAVEEWVSLADTATVARALLATAEVLLPMSAFVNPARDPARVPAAGGADGDSLPPVAARVRADSRSRAAGAGGGARRGAVLREGRVRTGSGSRPSRCSAPPGRSNARSEPSPASTRSSRRAPATTAARSHTSRRERSRLPRVPARAIGAREARGDRGRRRRGGRRRRHLRRGGRRRTLLLPPSPGSSRSRTSAIPRRPHG